MLPIYENITITIHVFLFSGFKLAKYDRGPSSNAPNSNDKVKVGATGRTFWSPQMLQTLQETRSTAQTIVARSGREISLTKGKNHAFKRYDDFPLKILLAGFRAFGAAELF